MPRAISTAITGEGLGSCYSSFFQVGDILPSTVFGQAKLRSYFNLTNGNLVVEDLLARVIEQPLPLDLGYVYNLQAPRISDCWRLKADKRFQSLPPHPLNPQVGDKAILVEPDGHLTTYTYDPSARLYRAPGFAHGTPYLYYDASTSTWVHYHPGTAITEVYNTQGHRQTCEDRTGHTTAYHYDSTGQLSDIIGATGIHYLIRRTGHTVTFSVQMTENTPATLLQTHTFDTLGRLTTTTTPDGYALHYIYAENAALINAITQSDQTVIRFIIDTSHGTPMVSAIYGGPATESAHRVIHIDRSAYPSITLTDSRKINTFVHLDKTGRVDQIKRELGYDTPSYTQYDITQFTYNDEGQRIALLHPNGGEDTYTYTSPGYFGLLASHTQPNSQVEQFYYSFSTRPSQISHVKELQGPDLSSAPTLQITRSVYDTKDDPSLSQFCRFKISPAGCVTEYRPDDTGHIKTKRVYTQQTIDLSSYPPNVEISLQQLEAWVAEQDPAEVTLTAYTYDNQGQVATITRYTAVDAKGNGILNDTTGEERRVRTLFGQVSLKAIQQSPDKIATFQYQYDGLQRCTEKRDALNHSTVYTYRDAQFEIAICYPNGRVETHHYNGQQEEGWCTEMADGVTRKTTFASDDAGRVVITEDPSGLPTYTFYDRQNRLGLTVSATGIVTQHVYDALHRYEATTQYTQTIDLKDLYFYWPPFPGELPRADKLLALLPKISHPQMDRTTYRFYDLSGRLQYAVDANAFVTETLYDSLNRVIGKFAYATPLSPAQLKTLQQGGTLTLTPDFNQDRCTLTFYDTDNHPSAMIDAAGYVTAFRRDAKGRVQEKRSYATPLPLATRKTLLQVGLSPKDAVGQTHGSSGLFAFLENTDQDTQRFYYYDARDQCIATLHFVDTTETEGIYYYTAEAYDAAGRCVKRVAYLTPVTLSAFQLQSPLPPPPPMSLEDRVTQHTYDLLNREIATHLPTGKITEITFDAMGNRLMQWERDAYQPGLLDGDHQLAHFARYDGFQQKIAELTPPVALSVLQIEANSTLTPAQKEAALGRLWAMESVRHVFDSTGLHIGTIAPDGGESTYYYDQERRRVVTINAIGTVTENTLNAFGESMITRHYKTSIPEKERALLPGGFLDTVVDHCLTDLKNDTVDAVTIRTRDQRGAVTEQRDPEGARTTWQYTAFQQCAEEGRPVNTLDPTLTIVHTYDARGLETKTLQNADGQTEVTEKVYANPFGHCTAVRNPLGEVTKTVYDRLGNPIATIDPTGTVRCTRTFDAFARPVTETNSLQATRRHGYQQKTRRHTLKYPEIGSQTTTFSNCFGETIEVRDSFDIAEQWRHAPDGQIVWHKDRNGYHTEQHYDNQGRKIRSIDANGIATEWTWNAVGYLQQTVYDTAGLRCTTIYHTDAWGQNEIGVDPNGVIQKNTYDRRGLLIQTLLDPTPAKVPAETPSAAPALNIITTKQYNAARQQIGAQTGDAVNVLQFEESWTYDGFNRCIAHTKDPNGLVLREQQHWNAANQQIATVDPSGAITRYFYDACGKKRFAVNACGEVKEWQRDSEGNVIVLRTFVTRLDPSALSDATTTAAIVKALQPDPLHDAEQWIFYDSNEQERFCVTKSDAQNATVTEKRYNYAGQVIHTIAYAAKLPVADISTLTTLTLAVWVSAHAGEEDRHNYKILDHTGQARFLIDAEQYLAENRFDGEGRIITTVAYATPVQNPAQLALLSPDALERQILLDPVNDRTTLTVFDSRGKPAFTVNAEGAVVRFLHDANGNLTETCAFATVIIVPDTYPALVALLKTLQPDPNKDRLTRYQNDAANRCTEKTDALGFTDRFQFDAVGNVLAHTDRALAVWENAYDAANRKISEKTPPFVVMRVTRDPSTGRLSATQQTEAVEKAIIYDKAGQKIQITLAANTPDARILKTTYDACQRPLTTVIPNALVDDPQKPGDFIHLPEKTVDLTTQIVYDGRGLPVCCKDNNGGWSFNVYDAAKQRLYAIDAAGFVIATLRNAFSEVITKIRYAIALTLDVSRYTTTGIPPEVVAAHLTASPADRYTVYQRDRRGDCVAIQNGAEKSVFYYIPTENGRPRFGYANPLVQQHYNAFRNCVYKARRISATDNIWQESLYWYSRTGKPLAIAEKSSLPDHGLAYRFTHYRYDAYDQPIEKEEFAAPLTPDAPLTSDLPLAMVERLIIYTVSKDRYQQITYDVLGNKIADTLQNQIRQQVSLDKSDIPQLTDLPPQSLTRHFEYNPRQQQIALQYEDGGVDYFYYNPAGFRIAQTEVTRKSVDNNGKPVVLTPLTYFNVNAFGETAEVIRFVNGTSPANPQQYPEPLAPDADDQHTLTLLTERGEARLTQNPEGYLKGFTYDANKNTARHFTHLTNPKEGVHCDEKRFVYDPVNNCLKKSLYRDNHVQQVTVLQWNAFHETTGEGPKEGTLPLFRHFDSCGKVFKTNEANGVVTVHLYDLTGQETARVVSPHVDLTPTPYTALDTLAAQYQQHQTKGQFTYEFTENGYDMARRRCFQKQPAYFDAHTGPQPLPLSLVVGTAYPAFGKTSLSWVTPQENNLLPVFSIEAQGSKTPKTLPLHTVKNRTGVDVSALPTDVYTYRIAYFFVNPVDHSQIQQYVTEGTVQIATETTKASQHLVVLVENDNQLRLTGHTQGLTGVALFQNAVKIADVPIVPVPERTDFIADLRPFMSGQYTIRPIQGKIQGTDSLPFVIYTAKPAKTPLSEEIPCQVNFSTLNTHAHLACEGLPTRYAARPLKIVCTYRATDQQNYTHTDTFLLSADKGHYTDKNGNTLICNTEFEKPVAEILSLSLWLQTLTGEFLPFLTQAMPAPRASVPATKNAPASEALPFPISDTIQTSAFAFQRGIYITPVHFTGILPTQLTFLDTRLDLLARWTATAVIGLTTDGLLINATGMAPGLYPYTLNDTDYPGFFIAGNSVVYPSEDFPKDAKTHFENLAFPQNGPLVQPCQHVAFDRWNNAIALTDPLGNTTHYDYNADNHVQRVTTPIVAVVSDKDSSITNRAITVVTGYNTRGFKVGSGTLDENGNTTRVDALFLNECGQCLQHRLGNGTVAQEQAFDTLGRVPAYWDSRGKRWVQQFDRLNRQIARTSPLKSTWRYAYNERNKPNAVTDPTSATRYYLFDVNGRLSRRLEPSLDTFTDFTWDRNGQKLTEHGHSPNNDSHLTYQRNYFGVLEQQTDYSSCHYINQYDFKGQLITSSSTNGGDGKHGDTLGVYKYPIINPDIHPHYPPDPENPFYMVVLTPTYDKSLAYTYRAGQLIEVRDHGIFKVTQYTVNANGQRTGEQQLQKGLLVRTCRSLYDALGIPVLQYDNKLTLATGFDGAGLVRNRRHLSAYRQQQQLQGKWNRFDNADFILQDGATTYSYREGNRNTCFRMGENTIQYQYNEDGLLIKSQDNNTQKYISRSYNARHELVNAQMPLVSLGDSNVEYNYDPNGNQTTQYQTTVAWDDKNNVLYQLHTQNTLSHFWSQAVPGYQETHWIDNEGNDFRMQLNFGYVGFADRLQLQSVGGKLNGGDYNSASLFYDGNGNPSGATGDVQSNNVALRLQHKKQDPLSSSTLTLDPYAPNVTAFDTHYDGRILSRQDYVKYIDPRHPDPIPRYVGGGGPTYFYTPEGAFLGSYTETSKGDFFLGLDYVQYANGPHGTLEVGTRNTVNPVPTDALTLADPTAPSGLSFPPPLPQTYIATNGDSWESLAAQLGDPSYAPLLAELNPEGLFPGAVIQLPRLMALYNNSAVNTDYETVVSRIIGNIQPALQAPPIHRTVHKKEGFFDEAFHFAVEAIAVTVGVMLGNVAGGYLASILVAGVTAAFLDAVGQSIEEALGIQDQFNWKETAEIGITAALAEGFAAWGRAATGANAAKTATTAKTAATASRWSAKSMAFEAAKNATQQQLLNLAFGPKGTKIDFRAIAAAFAEEPLDVLADTEVGTADANFSQATQTAVSQSVNDAINTTVNQLAEGKGINAESLAAQLLGDEIGFVLQDDLTQLRDSENYQKAKQASEGKTQTQATQKQQNTQNKSNNKNSKISPTSQDNSNQQDSADNANTRNSDTQQQAQQSRAQRWNQSTGPTKKWNFKDSALDPSSEGNKLYTWEETENTLNTSQSPSNTANQDGEAPQPIQGPNQNQNPSDPSASSSFWMRVGKDTVGNIPGATVSEGISYAYKIAQAELPQVQMEYQSFLTDMTNANHQFLNMMADAKSLPEFATLQNMRFSMLQNSYSYLDQFPALFRQYKLIKFLGKSALPVSIFFSAIETGHAPEGQKFRTGVGEVGDILGGVFFGLLGGAIGGAIDPFGGEIIGAIGGSASGGAITKEIFLDAYDKLMEDGSEDYGSKPK